MEEKTRGSNVSLTLGTVSFIVCFAVWGLISAFASGFRTEFHLSAKSAALLVAAPVLLGSLARIPLGMITDRLGGRRVFTALLILSGVAAILVPQAHSFPILLLFAFFLGLAGSSFAVGVGYVGRWFPAERQGTALGVYGLGNIGQSIVVFLGPVLAARIGRTNFYYAVAAVAIVWAAVFALLARDAPVRRPSTTIGAMLKLLTTERLAWALAAFYFLTFGGFVAFSIYLPSLLRDEFGLTVTDAGFRTAGFVVLATLVRPGGGILSDRIGGARVLFGVFLGIIPFALLLWWRSTVPFTVGALGCAALLGVGNGAVFKLVPQFFPENTATVTGLVGAMGGLGGFFPPLLLGAFRDTLGVIWPGWILLAATSGLMWVLNQVLFMPRQKAVEIEATPQFSRAADRIRAGALATMVTALLIASIVIGSRNLQNFDPALVIYTFAVIFATWGIVYHYAVWLHKPPTRRFFERSWSLLWSQGLLHSVGLIAKAAVTHIFAQRFIGKRSRVRWWMHQFLFWGCLLAVAITYPLVFGWIYFRSAPNNQMRYVLYIFGFSAGDFEIRTVGSWLLFHGLDVAAVLVLMGITLALWRRMRDEGALTLQDFSADFLPLILLFAISVTGLALTASAMWFRGGFYGFLSILHAITVIGGLLFLPFGKFFHIFQRPAQLGVKLYQEAGERGPGAICARCGQRYASQMQIEDLQRVLPALGFDYRINGPAGHWTGLCPACKRVSLANAQLRIKEEFYG
ncbi:MAG TPA: MFS transporter [Bryobacteraceae bacterium]|nr:MFS transporter [Bryobacteraceae bacterium]